MLVAKCWASAFFDLDAIRRGESGVRVASERVRQLFTCQVSRLPSPRKSLAYCSARSSPFIRSRSAQLYATRLWHPGNRGSRPRARNARSQFEPTPLVRHGFPHSRRECSARRGIRQPRTRAVPPCRPEGCSERCRTGSRLSGFEFAEVAVSTRARHWSQHGLLKDPPSNFATREQHESARPKTLMVLIRVMRDRHEVRRHGLHRMLARPVGDDAPAMYEWSAVPASHDCFATLAIARPSDLLSCSDEPPGRRATGPAKRGYEGREHAIPTARGVAREAAACGRPNASARCAELRSASPPLRRLDSHRQRESSREPRSARSPRRSIDGRTPRPRRAPSLSWWFRRSAAPL